MKNIFVTGASGCVGHYLMDLLVARSDMQCHVLVRDPSRLSARIRDCANVTIHIGDMATIENLASALKQMDYLIHVATDWSDSEQAHWLNVHKTHEMLGYLDPDRVQKVIYFSTASILGPGNQPVPEAGTLGSGYVSSKYRAFVQMPELPVSKKIVTVFPTLVFGGDSHHPYSHVSQGLIPSLGYLKWIRFLDVEGAFHFMHAADIAAVTVHLLENATGPAYVLGNAPISARQAIDVLCASFGVRRWVRLNVSSGMIIAIAKLFRITIGKWERYCICNPNMVYNVVSPASFGLPVRFPGLIDLLDDIKVNYNYMK